MHDGTQQKQHIELFVALLHDLVVLFVESELFLQRIQVVGAINVGTGLQINKQMQNKRNFQSRSVWILTPCSFQIDPCSWELNQHKNMFTPFEETQFRLQAG